MKTDKAAAAKMDLFKGFYTLPGADEAFDRADAHAAGTCGCSGHRQEPDAEETNGVPGLDIMGMLPGIMEIVEGMGLLPGMGASQEIALNRQFFHQGVKTLADPEKWFMPPINDICLMLDRMIEDGLVQLKHDIPRHGPAIGVGMSLEDIRKTLTFMLGIKNGRADMAGIVIPKGWWRKMIDNPFFRLGGVVMMASQACDFYHSVQPDRRRANAWEAQFLLAVLQKNGFYKLNSYQRWLLERFPRGLSSVHKDFLYEHKTFVPGTFRAKGREQKSLVRKPAKILTAGWDELIGYPLWR